MARYLFVPGGKRGASDWDQVRAILEDRGHATQAITLADPEHAMDEHWTYREIDADHYVMLDHAPELAAILEEM